MDVFTTGMLSASSASNTLRHAHKLLEHTAKDGVAKDPQNDLASSTNTSLAISAGLPVKVFRAAERCQAVCVGELGKHADLVVVLKLAATSHNAYQPRPNSAFYKAASSGLADRRQSGGSCLARE
jgi:hypothetical protein